MTKTIPVSILLFLLFLLPGVIKAQPFGRHNAVTPLGGVTAGLVNGRLDFHGNPSEDHYAFESLERHSYQYEALHGYEHYRGKELRNLDRFKDIRYPKDKPESRPSPDIFFRVEYYDPLKW